MTLILREMGNNVFSLFLQENLFIKSSTSVNNLFAPLETMPDNKFKKTILQKTKWIEFFCRVGKGVKTSFKIQTLA
jgi:hypothetical protein